MAVLKLLMTFAVLLSWFRCAWAGWSGPEKVLSGSWGAGESQFGFVERYNKADFPKKFLVDDDGNIIVADSANKRAKVYSRKGRLASIIQPKLSYEDAGAWPPGMIASGSGRFLAYEEGTMQQYEYSGNLAKEVRVPGGEFLGFLSDGRYLVHILEKKETESYAHDKGFGLFSSDGTLLRSSLLKPLDHGRSEEINEEKSNVHEAYTRIYYPDRTYTIINYPASKFTRGAQDDLFILEHGMVMKYRCGIFQAKLELPKSEFEIIRPGDAQSSSVYEVVSEFGEPVVVLNGAVYVWKRTPAAYSILKWTWKEEGNINVAWQNEPRNLTAVNRTDSIELLWDGSLQDPGCVTGYEIGRGTSSGGPYVKVGTVGRGVLRYRDSTAESGRTYYYAVRSVLSKDHSGYSNETQAIRQ